jgi:hypothetical protein
MVGSAEDGLTRSSSDEVVFRSAAVLRVSAWVFAVVFGLIAVSLLILPFVAFPLGWYENSVSVAAVVGFCFGGIVVAALVAYLVREFWRIPRRTLVCNRQGVSGLWVPRESHAWLDKLDSRGRFDRTPISWEQIDHAAVGHGVGSEGGGSYHLIIYLRDGRRARTEAFSAFWQKAAADRLLEQFEAQRIRFAGRTHP